MARKVLNISTGPTGDATVLSVSSTKTTSIGISNGNNTWINGNGYSWTHTRTRSDSYSIAHLSWDGGTATHSYFSGLGIKDTRPGGSSYQKFGWSYYWRHEGSGGDGAEHLFSCMSGWAPGDFNNESGNHTMQIGWNSINGSSNRPSERWTMTRSQDNRGNADNQFYSWTYELDPDKVSWSSSSGGHS